MLTEEQKSTIRAEELYRDQVIKELDDHRPEETRPTRFWKFLNSSFGIWLLSTCVVGITTFTFTLISEGQKGNAVRKHVIERLDTEIAARLHALDIEDYKVTSDSFLTLEVPKQSVFPSGIFREYRDRSFRSLLYELHSLVTSDEKTQIKEAISSTKHWYSDFKLLQSQESKDSYSVINSFNISFVYSGTLESLNLTRWDSPFDIMFKQHKEKQARLKEAIRLFTIEQAISILEKNSPYDDLPNKKVKPTS